MSPSSSFCWVRALNCLQNSMMLTCAWPSAGPTGGAGVALPAGICSFTKPVAFFAMYFVSFQPSAFTNSYLFFHGLRSCGELRLPDLCKNLLYLSEPKFDWSRTAKDGDHD